MGLIFLRYISAAFEKRYAELVAEGDGFEVVLDLRRMGMSDRTIAISGGGRTSAEDYLATAQHFDVAAIFSKPLDLQQLRNKVDEIIKAHS